MSRTDIMNSSGVPPESTFVVMSRRKLSVFPGAKDCAKMLTGVASVMTTDDDISPPTLPKVRGDPEGPPAPKLKSLMRTALFPSPVPLPSANSNPIENGPAGWPINGPVLSVML